MKRPTMLLRRILLDVRLQPEHTIDRDYREICSRYQREGLSFLTITLPRLDDVLLKGLSSGHISRADFEGFKPFKKRGSLPALLQGFFRCIFDDDGWLLSSPNVDAIMQSDRFLAFSRRSRSLVLIDAYAPPTGGMKTMTKASIGIAIGVLSTLAFSLALVATYGLTSKSYLENFIVFRVSSDQALQRDVKNVMNVSPSQSGLQGVKPPSLPSSTPYTMSQSPSRGSDFLR